MKKILFLVLIGLPFCAVADEEVAEVSIESAEVAVAAPAVVSRVVCADVAAEISELEKISKPNDEEAKHLQELKNQYRAQCGTVSRRRALNMQVDTVAPAPEAVVQETETPEYAVSKVPQITPEQMQEFLNSGLCANGEKPNRFGCCDGEKFTDMGDMKFACCVTGEDGNKTCFDPIK